MKASEHKKIEIEHNYEIQKCKRQRNKYVLWITLCAIMLLAFFVLFMGGVLLGSFGFLKAAYAAGMWIPGVIGTFIFTCCTYSLVENNRWEFEKVHQAERDLAKHMAEEIEYNLDVA